MRDRRARQFALLCILVTIGAVGYVSWARRARSGPAGAPAAMVADANQLTAVQSRPHILFRNTDLGALHGRLFVAPLDNPDGAKYQTGLTCERVAFAGGHGICLVTERGMSRVATSYRAELFDAAFTARQTFALPGIPSRARMSPSGRLATVTVFISGDSYSTGSFSTRALIIDVGRGEITGELESFAVSKDGQPFHAVDFNFWGITFVDDQRAYATLQTGGRRYLVEIDLTGRRARVMTEGVECPAISPDGTRIAFKHRQSSAGGRLTYQLSVLDLKDQSVRTTTEARSVDDQPEWLDDQRIAYGLANEARPGSTDVWTVAADGRGRPQRLIEAAWSPATVRPVHR